MNITGKGKKESTGKVIAAAITTAIIILLVLSGPANAFSVKLTSDKTSVGKAEKITFTAKINLENADSFLPVKNLTLTLSGPVLKYCIFDIEGKKIEGCHNINIKKINVNEDKGYGYGYNLGYGYNFGYGYGISQNLEYEITIHSQDFLPGTYKTQLEARIGDMVFSENGNDITINANYTNSNSFNFNGKSASIQFLNAGVSLDMETSENVNGTVRIVGYNTLPENVSGFLLSGISKFIEIDADESISGSLSNATINISYAHADLKGIDESTLRLYYYNAASNLWEKYDGVNGGVNTADNYVWAITDHFSIWGVFGNLISNNGNSGGGSWHDDNKIKKLPDEILSIPPADKDKNKKPETINLEDNLTDANTNRRAGITGAVIGLGEALGNIGNLVVLFFILGIVALAITINVVRNR